MSALVVLGELRAVGAFVTHVVYLHHALLSIAALRAAGHVLRRADLGRSKCEFGAQERRLLSFLLV